MARAIIAASRRRNSLVLSERELQVLGLLARGASNKEVAQQLSISARTVGHHVAHIYGKIGISTRAEAALFAMENDLL